MFYGKRVNGKLILVSRETGKQYRMMYVASLTEAGVDLLEKESILK